MALLYLFRFGARSPAEFYVLTALMVGGGAAFGALYARQQNMTSALRISATAGPGGVQDQVAAAYVSPQFSCGLVGRRTSEGLYEVALLTASDDVAALARALLSRVPPSP